jgi:hypothetical protein
MQGIGKQKSGGGKNREGRMEEGEWIIGNGEGKTRMERENR